MKKLNSLLDTLNTKGDTRTSFSFKAVTVYKHVRMNVDEKVVAMSFAFSSVCLFCPSQKPQQLYQTTKIFGEVKQACSSSCTKTSITNFPWTAAVEHQDIFKEKRDGSWPTSDSRQDRWGVRYLFLFAHWTVVKEQCHLQNTVLSQEYTIQGTEHSRHKTQFVLTVQLQGQDLHPPLHQEAEYETHRSPNFFPQQMDNPERCWRNASACTNALPLPRAQYKLLTLTRALQQKRMQQAEGEGWALQWQKLSSVWNTSVLSAWKKMAQTPKTSSLFLIPSISLGKRSWGKEKLGGKRSYVSLGCILAKALLSGFIWFRACFCLLK